MSDDKEREIRERAYAIWQSEGRPHGRSEQHWHQARAEVEASGAKAKAPGKAATTKAPATPKGATAKSVELPKKAAPAPKSAVSKPKTKA